MDSSPTEVDTEAANSPGPQQSPGGLPNIVVAVMCVVFLALLGAVYSSQDRRNAALDDLQKVQSDLRKGEAASQYSGLEQKEKR